MDKLCFPHPEVNQETEKTEVHMMDAKVSSKVKCTSKNDKFK